MTVGLSKQELFGHVPVEFGTPLRIRTEDCACGGQVTANVEDPAPSLLRHYETGKHRAWEVQQGMREPADD